MNPEPLNGKRVIFTTALGFRYEGVYNEKGDGFLFYIEDIKSAVTGFKLSILKLDASPVIKDEILMLINKWFKDVIE